ncbi:MAG: sulfotransferase domain-containing protein [Sphingomonadaceae bacterium]|nr:sulfotransferase domain-containing protein [Sphingomonadaceae bacterium]
MATKYVIVCQARTGSTMLATALQAHKDICAHGEVFGMRDSHLNFWGIIYEKDPPLIESMRRFRNENPVQYLRDFVLNPGRFKSVGFKFKFEELSQEAWKDVVADVAADRSLKILFLRRENLWQRFLSEFVAVHVTKMFNTTDKSYEQPETSIEIDPAKVEKAFQRSRRWERIYGAMFARHDRLDLSYEAISKDYDGVMREVQDFLGVPQANLKPATVKLTDRRTTVIKNLDAIREHFAGTEFAEFFEEIKTAPAPASARTRSRK